MPAGYSGKPLSQKLGFKPGMRAIVLKPPNGYARTLGRLPDGVDMKRRLTGRFDFIQLFVASRRQLGRELPRVTRALTPTGMLWVSWPKGASRIDTDLNGNVVRSDVLAGSPELVDIKVCAVDADWSALKFVHRRK